MSRIRVYLVVSGSGDEVEVGVVDTLDEASDLVLALDKRWEKFEDRFSSVEHDTTGDVFDALGLAASDPLRWYEGCDIYAERREEDGELVEWWALDTGDSGTDTRWAPQGDHDWGPDPSEDEEKEN